MKIIIIDDDNLVKTSLKLILEASNEVEVLALASNGLEGYEMYKQHQPDIVLSDIRMPEYDGIDGAKLILEYDNNAKIIFLTTFEDDESIKKALNLGIQGYILKQDYDAILPALKNIMNQQTVLSNKVMEILPNLNNNNYDDIINEFELSESEVMIIDEVVKGLSNKEIAQVLSFSEGTIRNHISSILSKLDLRDRTQLVIFYYERMK